jgi:superfamily II DNA or RNA helicase
MRPDPRTPPLHDWRTTDLDEIARRRQRAREEKPQVENRTPEHRIFSNFRVLSAASGLSYDVELRDLAERHFACTCVDFRTSGLGTCKHIEAALLHLQATEPAAFAAAQSGEARSARSEIVPEGDGQTLRVESGLDRLPARLRAAFDGEGRLRDASAAPRLVAELAQYPLGSVRLSQEVAPWLDRRRRVAERQRLRREYEQKVQAGLHPLSETTVPLFPYQREGMLHLAFTERALLADEMGLGKTIQAIAASALLHRLGQARRVLVVTPASLKAEWEEQIQRFTALPGRAVNGTRTQRLAAYDRPSFFSLVTYEQARSDLAEINARLRPDVVILDEAQRIKTWRSATAQAIKRLRSRYAFVLTGTPLENRIDELYSIVEFLDPSLLGPLFRFNREYYRFDERGRPVAYQNLEKLRETLRPVLLRRRKADVENELPSRHDRQRMVALSDAQRRHYSHHEREAAALLALSQRRALLPREQERLMRELAMMRMACDSSYLLTGDAEDRADCPKLVELDAVLAAALAEEGVKVVIFSEWLRMLELVRELLERRKIGFARHTGALRPAARRAELLRFRDDPACRVLVSSESGGVGLNLQMASVVINCDLPWSPARYEQRVARVWRKHQLRPVTVVNLIAEATLEHRMLGTMAVKQGLADGVLDGRGDLERIPLRRGGAALLERVRAVLGGETPSTRMATAAPIDPAAALVARARQLRDVDLVTCEERQVAAGAPTLWIVVETDAARAKEALERLRASASHPAERALRLEVIDRAAAELLARLEEQGLVQRTARVSRTLFPSAGETRSLSAAAQSRVAHHVETAGRQLRLARLLSAEGGDFPTEAAAALRNALAALSAALATRETLPEPLENEGPVPARLAPLWGTERPAIEEFLRNAVRPTTAALESAERVRTQLATRIAVSDT